MSEKIFYVDAVAHSKQTNSVSKLRHIVEALIAEKNSAVRAGDLCALKTHFGEMGNDAYISPVLARVLADAVSALGAKPFFTDTNTLYSGSRSNAVDHLRTASAHGFVPEVCGAPVIIADGLKSNDWREVQLPPACTQFGNAKIAGGILDADSMIVLSHVKGHEMAGFGGAIKNLAMGCAPFVGKREQHCVKFMTDAKRCIACGQCAAVCPVGAARMTSTGEKQSAYIEQALCIGCGECLAHCPQAADGRKAIHMDWSVGLAEFTEKMTEYALAAVTGKAGRVLYVNIITKVVPLCDCVPWSGVPVVPDIGFLAGSDPVALDQASFDLVKAAPVCAGSMLDGKAGAGDDKFTAMHPETHSELQLSHGERIGLGSRSYELVRL